MPRGCDHDTHVRLSGRYFIVEYNADGNVLRIKERKAKSYAPRGVSIGVFDASWWVATSHPLGTGDTLPKRVIAAAHAKRTAEDISANATP